MLQAVSAQVHDKTFLLQVVQPGLVGLMDGSVSTLAPVFVAAFATGDPYVTFLVGASASVGAGISMAFAEALSDTGVETGRGHPVWRGGIIGAMTFVGGILHALPFLIPTMSLALTVAYIVAAGELIAIAYIRYHYFHLNFFTSVIQVVVAGALVLGAGLLIGHA
jgi:erythrin-vacuolar iron transport family protein